MNENKINITKSDSLFIKADTLFSIGKDQASRPLFEASDHFVVNVLCAEQESIAWQFAKPIENIIGIQFIQFPANIKLYFFCLLKFVKYRELSCYSCSLLIFCPTWNQFKKCQFDLVTLASSFESKT